jgi:hypothetical protein|tara:strand:- start:323 stop:514 length:192 start_codon:yes stop_codon:yes gene_type:complete
MQDREFRQDIHLILQQIKDLKANDLSHLDKRLTKLEVASKFHTALLFMVLATIVAFGFVGLSS